MLFKKLMFQNARVTLKGVVKNVEKDTFKGSKGEDIALTYVYIEQEDVMTLAKVQVKPADLKINKGDLFDGDLEIRINKGFKGETTLSFIYTHFNKKGAK